MGKDGGAEAGKKLVALWQKRGGREEEALRAAEMVISGWHQDGFEGYLADLTPEGGEGSTCTSVWTAGTIAYRCRTCQTSDSSAICITCFKDGGHELHDYVLYRSEAGGCCDCGDLVSWKPSGCCPAHAPAGPAGGGGGAPSFASVPPELRAQGALTIRLVLEHLLAAVRQGGEEKEATAARILEWLQVVCNAPALRALVCEQLLDPTGGAAMAHGGGPRAGLCGAILDGCTAAGAWRRDAAQGSDHAGAGSILDTLLGMFSSLPGEVMEIATTVLLILLYNHEFKYRFTCLLLRHYATLVLAPYDEPAHQRAQVQSVATCLDRLTVQLFNVPAVTLQLVREERLLDTFMSLLSRILQRTCTAQDGRINPESAVIEDKMYSRVLGDLRMVVSHREAVHHVLSERHDLLCRLLAVLAPMQGMHPYTLQRGDHVEHEPATWTHAVTLEVHLLAILSIMLAPPDGAAATPPVGAAPPDAVDRSLLVRGASITLDFAATWVKSHAISPCPREAAWAGLCAGEPVSLHLPLHRAVGSFLGALLAADVAAGGAGGSGPLGGLLSGRDARDHMATLLDELLRVAAWLAQIRARLWVRNGEHVFRLERVYRSSYWHEYGLDLDTVVMQLCFASAADPGAVLHQVVQAFGGQALLDSAAKGRAARAVEPEELSCLVDMVTLVATLVRERQAAGMSPRECLRRELVHWLCYSDHTHTQLSSALPAGLAARSDLDAVLAEVADFSQPKLQDRGKYAIKKEEWESFDPFFLHYSRADLEEAMGRAQASGVYKMEWVLRPPARGPPSVERAFNVVHSPACHQLVWGALAYGLAHPSTAADDLCMGAIQLLALALGDPRSAEEGNPRLAAAAAREAAGPAALLAPAGAFGGPDVVEAADQVPPGGGSSIKEMLQKLSAGGSPGAGGGGGAAEGESGVRVCARAVLGLLRKARAESTHSGRPSAPGSSEDGVGSAESREKAAAEARKKAARERQAAIMREFSQKQAVFLEGADDMMSSDEEDEDKPGEGGAGGGEGSSDGSGAPGLLSPRGRGKDCALCRGQAGGNVGLGWIALMQPSSMPHTTAHPVPSDSLLRAIGGGGGAAPTSPAQGRGPASPPVLSPTGSRGGAAAATAPPSPTVRPEGAASQGPSAAGAGEGEDGVEGDGEQPLHAAPPVLDSCLGLHAQVCGHKVHFDCFVRYFDTLLQSQKSGRPFEGANVVTLENTEFLCPICRRLGNAVLPDLAVPPPCHAGFLVRPDPDSHGALKHSDSEVVVGAALRRSESLGTEEAAVHKSDSEGALKRTVTTGSGRAAPASARWEVEGGVDAALEAARGALSAGEPFPRPLSAPVTDAFVRQCRRVLVSARRDTLRGSPGVAQLAGANAILWGALAHCVARYEVAVRAPAVAAAPASPGEAFSWRATVALGRLLLSPESPAGGVLLPPERRAAALAWLAGQPGGEAAAAAPPAVLTVLPPLPPPGGPGGRAEPPTMAALLATDPFTLFLELLAGAPCRGRRGQPAGLEDGLRALLRLVYLVAVTQGAVACVLDAGRGPQAPGAGDAEAPGSPMRVDSPPPRARGGGGGGSGVVVAVLGEAAAMRGAPEQWAAMEAAIGSRLLVLLRRATVLVAALEGADTGPALPAGASADELAAALGLPPVSHALAAVHAAEAREGGGARALAWCAHLLHPAWEHARGVGDGARGGVPRPVALRPPALLQLPGLFQELYIRWSDQPCTRCGMVPQEPALCLVCGALLCCAGDCCRSSHPMGFGAGECYRHVAKCGGGVGVLLLVKATRVLLLRDRRACVGPSLYLDQHGEEDWYLKRGRPLHLSRLRYEELSRLWVTGAFDFDTHTLHHSRGGAGHLGAEWY